MNKAKYTLIIITIVLFACSCNRNTKDVSDIIESFAEYRIGENPLQGKWIDISSNDTFYFTTQHELLNKEISDILIYFYNNSDNKLADTLVVSKMECDTFYSSTKEIDSIKCNTDVNYFFQILHLDSDSITLSSFINSTGPITLQKLE